MHKSSDRITVHLTISGRVQGVGFRPFVYRLAAEEGIAGWVRNTNANVEVVAQGSAGAIRTFIDRIRSERPPAANIQSIEEVITGDEWHSSFEIRSSADVSDRVTEISPDIAVCEACLRDMKEQPHRIDYPLINCTHCGPRFSIIESLPYDRSHTTMKNFALCSLCSGEYHSVSNRRFHAQPVACNQCGPQYFIYSNGQRRQGTRVVLTEVAERLHRGEVVAIKGTGGYHLCCDALNTDAVNRLRSVKLRDAKPFAVMFRNLSELKCFAEVTKQEEELLTSWQRPIVLLRSKKLLPPPVSAGFSTLGAMLPYMPFHYLLFEKISIPALVFTSGNLSDEPVITDDHKAIEKFGADTAAVISYNREIHNRVDDPVLFIANNRPRMIRRARSYVPVPVKLTMDAESVFAAGAELVNTFAIGKGDKAILSQHIGDLKNAETYDFYTSAIEKFYSLFRFKPSLIACDMHPDYFSTRYALSLDLPVVQVQHHHAHVASCMAEHGLDEPVIGISFDGTGLGTDGTIWGGEVFWCDLNQAERIAHLVPIPLPGGDKAVEQPWRTALSFLYAAMGSELRTETFDFLKNIPEEQIRLIIAAIDKKINTPLCSSAGRLFDAVSALLGLCTRSSFHAEAPMRLEDIAAINCTENYSVPFNKMFNTPLLIQKVVEDMTHKVSKGIISARFHNTLISFITGAAQDARERYNLNKVVLSGGVFQNRYLLGKTENDLIKHGFEVFSHQDIPSNDGGIALGQLVIAAKRRYLCV